MTSPSPVVQYSNDGVTWQTAGSNFTATASITGHIRLANNSGANYWSLTCVSTDETSSAATVNASITYGAGKTATFSTTTTGTSLLFTSTVGVNGANLDGANVYQSTFTTQFEVNVLTTGGLAVIAVGETVQHDPVFGSTGKINAPIRALGTAATSTVFQLAPMDLNENLIASFASSTASTSTIQPPSLITLSAITGTSQFTPIGTQNMTVTYPATNELQFVGSNSSNDQGMVAAGSPPLGGPNGFIWTTIQSATYTGSTPSYADYAVGFGSTIAVSGLGVTIKAIWRAQNGGSSQTAHFQIITGGTSSDQLGSVNVTWTPPFNIGLSLVANSVGLWYQAVGASTWTLITKYSITQYDFRSNGSFVANNMYPMLYAATGPATSQSTTVVFKGLTSGSFGGVGIRDANLVTTQAGLPVFSGSGGTVTLTATLEDQAAAAYCGVLSLNMTANPPTLAQTGVVWTQRIVPSGTSSSVSTQLSGTFTTTNGSATVTATSSQTNILFGGSMPSIIQFSGQTSVNYTVASVSGTSITLTTPFTGTGASGQTALMGVWCNDNAAHFSQDGSGNYNCLISSWEATVSGVSGNPNLWIYYENEPSSILSGIQTIYNPVKLSLPSIPTGGGCYDPFMFYNSSNSLYYIGFVNGPNSATSFYPSLASCATITGSWSLVGTDTTAVPYEGTRIVYLNGQYWAIWSSLSSQYNRVYDMSMNYQGGFKGISGNTVHAPHATLIPLGSYVYYVTFDSTLFSSTSNTDGTLYLYRALGYGIHP